MALDVGVPFGRRKNVVFTGASRDLNRTPELTHHLDSNRDFIGRCSLFVNYNMDKLSAVFATKFEPQFIGDVGARVPTLAEQSLLEPRRGEPSDHHQAPRS